MPRPRGRKSEHKKACTHNTKVEQTHTLCFRHSSPISFKGWMTPISLFTAMTDTSVVSGRMASSRTFKSTLPSLWTGTYVTSKPGPHALLAKGDYHRDTLYLLSFASDGTSQEHTCVPTQPRNPHTQVGFNTTFSHRLSGNNMSLLLFIESSDSFDGNIVTFSSTGCEYNILGTGIDQCSNLLRANNREYHSNGKKRSKPRAPSLWRHAFPIRTREWKNEHFRTTR